MTAAPVPGSVFEEPWWLDAVAPGSWRELLSNDGGEAAARLTVQVLHRHGLTIVRNAPLTPVVGPSFVLTAQKHEGRLAQVRALVEGLIASLPSRHHLRLVFAPGFDDHLPFRWAGFQTSLAVTYRIDDLSDPDRVWAGFSESCRRAIRKADKSVVVRDDATPDAAIDCAGQSFARQGKALPFRAGTLNAAMHAAMSRGAGRCMLAEDSSGRVHAAAMIVHDARSAYYLAGGADPALRSSGAQSLLLWTAIKQAAGKSAAFDFEGSSNREIERFFRSFGPRRVPLLAVGWRAPLLRRLDALGLLPAALGGL